MMHDLNAHAKTQRAPRYDFLRPFVLSTNILNRSGRGAPGPSGRFPVYMAVGDRKTRPRSTEMTYRA